MTLEYKKEFEKLDKKMKLGLIGMGLIFIGFFGKIILLVGLGFILYSAYLIYKEKKDESGEDNKR